jgi:transcriptional regulator with XRE-family HTH domain
MDSDKFLGDFFRARREATTLDDVGLKHSGRRRTPGLRREEVAMLAGVSTDYYVRLEQGRERHPSERVLASLVEALSLGPEAAAHLYELAHPRPRQPQATDKARQVSPDLLRLMRSWPDTPALVCGRWMDVLATNSLADALHNGHEYTDNLLQLVFLEPAAREFYRDWEKVARSKVAHLRAAAGADLDDPYLIELIGELSDGSSEFCRLWARHDISGKTRETKRLRHREVGDLTLTCEVFDINSAPGQQLIVLQAEPASPSEHALALLSDLAATAS